MAEKIRCCECGNIIAYENEPINDKGEISIMCNNRKPNGKRCKTINIIRVKPKSESEISMRKSNEIYAKKDEYMALFAEQMENAKTDKEKEYCRKKMLSLDTMRYYTQDDIDLANKIQKHIRYAEQKEHQ